MPVELTSEDELRLNVLLVSAKAIRIDDSRLTVSGMTDGPDLQLTLNPVGAPEKYVQRVRAYISTAVLGSPRHFPTHLHRWAGLRQSSNAPLEKLLMLGDPEAAFAVACSPRVTAALAHAVWWAYPGPEIARQLLTHSAVVASPLGVEIARWLFDYLPFETESAALLEASQLLLQPGLLDAATRTQLWNMGRRRKAYRIGFLAVSPMNIPHSASPRELPAAMVTRIAEFAGAGDPVATVLLHSFSAVGQMFIATALDALAGASTAEEATVLVNAIGRHFRTTQAFAAEPINVPDILAWAESAAANHPLYQVMPSARGEIRAVLLLGQYNEELLIPVLARSDAVGTVLRKQMDAVIAPVAHALKILMA